MSRHAETSEVQRSSTVRVPRGYAPATGVDRVQMHWPGEHSWPRVFMLTGYRITSDNNTHLDLQSTLLTSTCQAICDLLQVEGAAGQEVPYLGYIEVTITSRRSSLVLIWMCVPWHWWSRMSGQDFMYKS